MRAVIVAVALALLAPAARADVTAAARAFADGQSAQLEGNLERAAQSFELAYSIQPSKEALRSAARARHQAGQLARAATHAETLLARFGDDGPSVKLAESILAEARPKLGRLDVTCPAPGCSLAIDGRALSTTTSERQIFYVSPGKQSIEASFADGQTATKTVTPGAGDKVDVRFTAPPPKSVVRAPEPEEPTAIEPDRPPRRGLPRLVTYIGIGATAALAGVTIWSGLDTKSAHDDYVKMPTQEGWDDGRAKQLRTNVLLGGTIAVGVATALVAVLWTDWHPERGQPALTVAPDGRGGLAVGVSGAF